MTKNFIPIRGDTGPKGDMNLPMHEHGPKGEKGEIGIRESEGFGGYDERRAQRTDRFVGVFANLGELPLGQKRDIAIVDEQVYVHDGVQWHLSRRNGDETLAEGLIQRIDDSLDPEKADKEIKDSFASPIVRRVVNFVLFILFGIFAIYAAAFYFEKELPQIEFLKHYLDQTVEVLKLFVG